MESQINNSLLSKLLVPESTPDFSDIESRFPRRQLSQGAKVVRVAPSPTGFAHFGLIFTSMVNEQIAHLSDGIFFLRIEDTDKKREIAEGVDTIITALKEFDIHYSEGPDSQNKEVGEYGPYIQSHRQDIYLSAIKSLIDKGFAYPCFCNQKELDNTRHIQEVNKEKTGYYGKYATCRNLSIEEIVKKLDAGEPYTIRFRTPNNPSTSTFIDSIKGEVILPGNDTDYVLIKSSQDGPGLPVYHFAAMVDDHLQGVNLVIRGDEWLPSLPLHLQIIDAFGWSRPNFGHLSPVMKMDGAITKRKLSKRKDPEADTSYYLKLGIPPQAVRAYVLNIADSRFESWRQVNHHAQLLDFPFSLKHMGSSGALFDMSKFLDICKQEISIMKAGEIYTLVSNWSKKYNPQFYKIFSKDRDYSTAILNIERQGDNRRKDLSQWSQIPELFGFFYDEIFDRTECEVGSENITNQQSIQKVIESYLVTYQSTDSKEVWLDKLRALCQSLGCATSVKEFKSNPLGFKGHLGDVAMIIRTALSGKRTTPDLYEMMQVMGINRVTSRLKKATT